MEGAANYTKFYDVGHRESTAITLGIVSPRVIISILTGVNQSETGVYGDVGLTQTPSLKKPVELILGAQRKNYLNLFGGSQKNSGPFLN